MKAITAPKILSAGMAALAVSVSASAQLLLSASQTPEEVLFRVDIKTVTIREQDALSSPIATRLFLDRGHTVPAPVGTTLWFIADLSGNGLPFTGSPLPEVDLAHLLGPDDRVLFRDTIDGDQPGEIAGRYRRLGVGISGLPTERGSLENANLWLILWNAAGAGANYQPSPGANFGIYNVGIRRPPAGLGNAFWSIEGNFNAVTLTVVPEPARYALFLGIMVSLLPILRRVRRSRAPAAT
jgi:hypothetical protein